jgi:hypothetical protein
MYIDLFMKRCGLLGGHEPLLQAWPLKSVSSLYISCNLDMHNSKPNSEARPAREAHALRTAACSSFHALMVRAGRFAPTELARALCAVSLKLSAVCWLVADRAPDRSHTGGALTVVLRLCVQVARNADLTEWTKLEFLREIGFCHMRIGDGVNSRLQLSGMLAKLCKFATPGGS